MLRHREKCYLAACVCVCVCTVACKRRTSKTRALAMTLTRAHLGDRLPSTFFWGGQYAPNLHHLFSVSYHTAKLFSFYSFALASSFCGQLCYKLPFYGWTALWAGCKSLNMLNPLKKMDLSLFAILVEYVNRESQLLHLYPTLSFDWHEVV